MQATQNQQQHQQKPSMDGFHPHGSTGVIQTLAAFYQQLSADKLNQLADIYSSDVTFIDPVAKHTGLDQLTAYFENLLKDCTSCVFDIHEKNVDKSAGWMRWTMSFEHPRLNAGKSVKVEGMSLIKIVDNRITYQRDFYDMGEMLYENLPLLGRLIKFIRRRMAK